MKLNFNEIFIFLNMPGKVQNNLWKLLAYWIPPKGRDCFFYSKLLNEKYNFYNNHLNHMTIQTETQFFWVAKLGADQVLFILLYKTINKFWENGKIILRGVRLEKCVKQAESNSDQNLWLSRWAHIQAYWYNGCQKCKWFKILRWNLCKVFFLVKY